MQFRTRGRLLLKAVAAVCAAAAIVLVASAPAQAFGSLTADWATVDTGSCVRNAGNLKVIPQSGGCSLPDSVDGTFFVTDAGGVGAKMVLRDSRGMVAKVEFHPYGEYLWVYDTRNDGDTIYVTVLTCNSSGCDFWGPFSPPGTSNAIDYKTVDLDIPEGAFLTITIYDDAQMLQELESIQAIA